MIKNQLGIDIFDVADRISRFQSIEQRLIHSSTILDDVYR